MRLAGWLMQASHLGRQVVKVGFQLIELLPLNAMEYVCLWGVCCSCGRYTWPSSVMYNPFLSTTGANKTATRLHTNAYAFTQAVVCGRSHFGLTNTEKSTQINAPFSSSLTLQQPRSTKPFHDSIPNSVDPLSAPCCNASSLSTQIWHTHSPLRNA